MHHDSVAFLRPHNLSDRDEREGSACCLTRSWGYICFAAQTRKVLNENMQTVSTFLHIEIVDISGFETGVETFSEVWK